MRGFGAPLRICLLVLATVASRTATGRVAELRTFLLIACTSILMTITGCSPASAATRHIVLLFDERVELPGLSLLEDDSSTHLGSTLPSRSRSIAKRWICPESSDYYRTHLRDVLRAKHADKKIDVAVAIMAPGP